MGKPGKYAHITSRLPKFVDPDTDRVTILTATIQAIKDETSKAGRHLNASYVATQYETIRLEKTEVEEKLFDLNFQIQAFEQLLNDYYEVEGITSLKLDSGCSVRIQYEPYANVVDRQAFRQWCLSQGFEDQMQLHPSTTQALVKERLLDGENEPDGVKAYVKSKIVYTKA